MIFVAIGGLYNAAFRIFSRGKSICKFAILLTLLAWRAIFLIILFCAIKIYTNLKAVTCRLVLHLAVCMAKPHHYRPFEQPASDIRLLKVRSIANVCNLPGAMLVKADLISVPIASAPPFSAISYRWTYSDTVPTLINNEKFAMSRSIYELLCALEADRKDSNEEQLLWIDSICINQADITEKVFQISLMRDIYSSASQVIGWLGSDAPPVNRFRGLEDAVAAATLVSNDFFFRVWIIQEVALARRLVLRSKHDASSWDEGVLATVRRNAPSFSLYGENQMGIPASMMTRLGQGINNTANMDSFRDLLKENPGGIPLGELLVQSAEFHCTDPRDRIFGLLGLTTKMARSAITVSYDDSYLEVHASMQAIRISIRGESSFQLLELSGIGLDADLPHLTDRPSWIPTWGVSHIPKTKQIIMKAKSHRTATHLPLNVEFEDNGANSDRVLRIEGAIVDSIKHLLTPPWHLPMLSTVSDDELLSQIIQFLDQLDMVCAISRGDQSPPPGISDARNAMIRTIIHGGPMATDEQDLEEARKSLEMASEKLRKRLDSPQYRKDLHGSTTHMDYMHFVMYLEESMPLIVGRRLCTTECGSLAIVPAFAEVGDQISVLFGAPNPFVIRPHKRQAPTDDGDRRAYQLAGAACVDGIMKGGLQKTSLNAEMLHII